MKKAQVSAKAIEKTSIPASGMLIGKVIRMNESGQVLVDFPGNPSGPLIARITAAVQRELQARGNPSGREVLLAFVTNDLQRPVIVDAMYSVLDDIIEPSFAPAADAPRPEEAVVDGKRVVFDAEEEVVLKCGKARITLTKAGKVLIEGEYVSSAARGAHKIKGGSIHIN